MKMQIRRQWLVVTVALAMVWCGRASAQVLDQVPADALVVLKIKNLEQVSKKAAKIAKGLGLDVQDAKWADPLGALEEEAHLGKGVNRAGDVAIVFVDSASVGNDNEKAFIALVPTDDYKAFLGNFKATEAEGEITKATPHDGPHDVYIANWGKYAAISPTKELLGKKPTGLKLEGLAAKESEAKDAILYANVKALRGKLLPDLKKGRDDVLGLVENALDGVGDAGKKFTPLAKAAVNLYLNIAEQFLQDTNSAAVAINLSDEGISTTFIADFEPGSYLGKLAAENKNSEASLLAGLPDRRYFAFGGSTANPKAAAQVMSDMLDPIAAELGKIEETKNFVGVIDALKKSAGATTGMAMGYVAPTGAMGTESILQQVVITHGDAKVIHEAQRKTLEAIGDVYKMLPQQAQVSTKFEIQPGAKNVDGVSLDTYASKMEFGKDDPAAIQVQQTLGMIYGPNGLGGVLGEVNDKTFVMLQGASDPLIADTIAAARQGTDSLSNLAGVKMVAAQLPKSRSAAFYVSLDTMVGTGLRYAKGFGVAVNVKIPANLPPIGMTAGSEGSAIRFDVFVPNTLIQAMVSAGMQFQQQMSAHGPPGGGV